jgi:diaminohydroxyphosphoribosylaminopyrimidine deaminase/5-amino-6-(5-phosphoribosylamino)uracil reductase
MSGWPTDDDWMQRALELAARGQGRVEPNPMVGCVLVQDNRLLSEGWHEFFGGAHAEVNAIRNAQGSVAGCTAYVTLEPCSHFGKTPPCADALIEAAVRRVVIAQPDPNPLVAGKGIERLKSAGIEVDVDVCQNPAADLLAPYLKRTTLQLPWIIAKWAMTWDGKIATASGDSQWISNEQSRSVVHQIRGRVDGIMVGINTVLKDDPLLTARPAGVRQATRIVLDSQARTPIESQICRTANEFRTLIAVGPDAEVAKIERLRSTGCEVWQAETDGPATGLSKQAHSHSANARLMSLLSELSRRRMTNVLVEGGSELLGSLFDLRQIDEVHLFLGGKMLGGREALTPMGGTGLPKMLESQSLTIRSLTQFENDVYLVGRVDWSFFKVNFQGMSRNR